MVYSLHSESIATTTTSSSQQQQQQQQVNYQVYRVESPANHHKLFIQAEASHPHQSFFVHVIHTADPSQRAMTFVEDTADSSDPLAGTLAIKHLGSVAPGAFDSFRAACRENPPPEKPDADRDTEDERLRRSRVWARRMADLLLEGSILQPRIRAALAAPSLQLPRHHHTRYRVNQRLHYHPYRRRSLNH